MSNKNILVKIELLEVNIFKENNDMHQSALFFHESRNVHLLSFSFGLSIFQSCLFAPFKGNRRGKRKIL